METATKTDVYSIITNKIIEQLEQGIIPWRRPWSKTGIPKNLISQKPYKGINVFLLSMLGYASNYFLTRRQANALGAHIKQGEKPHIVVYWKIEQEERSEEEANVNPNPPKTSYMLRYFSVFNIEQVEGLDTTQLPQEEVRVNNPIAQCEAIIHSMNDAPDLKHQGNEAYYVPSLDCIYMPDRKRFDSSQNYYHVLFHELIHATGHSKRLNREGVANVNTKDIPKYSYEELIAEIGSCFLNFHAGLGIHDLDNSAAYIQGWLEKLQSDNKCIIYASIHAQKAVDCVMNA